VNTEAIRNKQYNYSGVIISHGERIEDIPEYVPKKSACAKIKDFFMKQQKIGRRLFVFTVKMADVVNNRCPCAKRY
jgi:hypothetical protein